MTVLAADRSSGGENVAAESLLKLLLVCGNLAAAPILWWCVLSRRGASAEYRNMKHDFRNVFLAAAICVAGFSSTATTEAAERGINIPPEAITIQGTAVRSSTVDLPNTATPSVFISFVLPPDYAAETTVKLQIHMQQASGACKAVVDVAGSTRRRNGLASVNSGGGIQPAGNNPVVNFAGSGIVKVKTYIIKPPVSGVITGIRPGDAIAIRLDRLVNDVNDDCGSTLFLSGAQIIYEYVV